MEIQKPKVKNQNCAVSLRLTTSLILHFAFLIFNLLCAGCQNTTGKQTQLSQQIEKLTQEKTQLVYQLEQFRAENEQLKKQIQVLSGLAGDRRLENLYNVVAVKIGKFTNLYDKDKDGKREKLIVYIQPIDENGDIIKAIGGVDVALWDLSKEANRALLGQWQVEPERLKECWFTGFMASNYRLTFDVADKIDKFEEPLTVRVIFTDYLCGKVFSQQKVIKP